MLKYKGEFNGLTTYGVGNVVVYTDGLVYHLQQPAAAGTPCTNTKYWGLVPAPLCDVVLMFQDNFDTLSSDVDTLSSDVAELNTVVFDNKTLVLQSSTEGSTNKYAVTVDDADDPELVLDLITEAEGGEE